MDNQETLATLSTQEKTENEISNTDPQIAKKKYLAHIIQIHVFHCLTLHIVQKNNRSENSSKSKQFCVWFTEIEIIY
jgi:hypothetical protein